MSNRYRHNTSNRRRISIDIPFQPPPDQRAAELLLNCDTVYFSRQPGALPAASWRFEKDGVIVASVPNPVTRTAPEYDLWSAVNEAVTESVWPGDYDHPHPDFGTPYHRVEPVSDLAYELHGDILTSDPLPLDVPADVFVDRLVTITGYPDGDYHAYTSGLAADGSGVLARAYNPLTESWDAQLVQADQLRFACTSAAQEAALVAALRRLQGLPGGPR